jgi:hypothetical protein
MGTFAAELCHDGNYGRRVGIQQGRLTSVPLKSGVVPHKQVDIEGTLVRAARLVGIDFGDAAE